MAKKQANYTKWLLIGFLSVIIGAPNGTIIKSTLGEIDSTTFTFLKFAMMFVIFLPVVISFLLRHKKVLQKNARSLTISVIGTVVSVIVFYKAIEYSAASYASIISLLSPIVLVIMSAKLIRERVGPRALAGITLAAIGGLLVVAVPAFFHGSAASVFYPLATVLVLINCISSPLSVIYQRKANEGGVSFSVYAGLSALATAAAALVMSWLENGPGEIIAQTAGLSLWGWVGIVYSAFVVSFASRSLWIVAYQRMGSTVSGGLSYLETLLAIALPIILLGEKLSLELVTGALLILLGIYVAESRPRRTKLKSKRKASHHTMRSHYLQNRHHLR
ncbi:MAG: DMT family transporter [Sphaerimonospora mesophila]